MHPEALQIWIFIITTVFISLLFLGFVCRLIGKHLAKNREYAHLERIKALELGQPVGPSVAEVCQKKYLHNTFWICFWIGAAVPIVATASAATVMIEARPQNLGVILAIWICAAVIAVAGVVSAAALMFGGGYRRTNEVKSSLNSDKTVQAVSH
jgi:hypothetical protein